MNLERARVRIRERSLGEVLDLAFLFLKMNARPFLIVGMALAAPMSAVTYWFFHLIPHWYFWFVTLAFLTPSFRLPFLVLAGDAMFNPDPSIRNSLFRLPERRDAFIRRALMRLLLAASVVGIIYKWWTRYFEEEIIALERVPHETRAARARNFHANLRSESRQCFFAHLTLGSVFVASVASVWILGRVIFEDDFALSLSPELLLSFPVVLGYWVAQVYFAVSEFLWYLNLRTIHEGWELFLQMRIVRRKLEAVEKREVVVA